MHVDGQSVWKMLNRLRHDLLPIIRGKMAFCNCSGPVTGDSKLAMLYQKRQSIPLVCI